MATFFETVLPSGKGFRVEKLKTKQFRQCMSRANAENPIAVGNELLISAFRGITSCALEWKYDKEAQPDVDAMLAGVPEGAWIQPTYEQLVTEGPGSLDELLDDPADYTAALQVVQSVVLPDRKRADSLSGKVRMVSVER